MDMDWRLFIVQSKDAGKISKENKCVSFHSRQYADITGIVLLFPVMVASASKPVTET